jgi:alpha,alpha-trehalase
MWCSRICSSPYRCNRSFRTASVSRTRRRGALRRRFWPSIIVRIQNSPDALRSFVDAHFSLPESGRLSPSAPEQVPILRHIDALWDPLTRNTSTAPRYSSLLPLPHAYVVPGGRFREIYYWDSYFTMLGLEQSDRHDLVDSMVRDFAYLIDTYGHVPNGTRSYYLSRSQPPFFFEMVALFSTKDPAAAYARYLPQLQREYAFWMDGQNTP